MQCLDYGRSFICGTASFNAVRFWVESRTTISDASTGESVDYYQCGSCKSENTFAERDLFHADNYDFLPILGQGEWLIFRRPARISEDYKRIQKVEDVWGPPDLKLKFAPARELSTWEAIRDATAAGLPLVTRTELENTETGLKAVIECLTKTMNVSLDNRQYQVDTGPVAFPDLSQRHDPAIAASAWRSWPSTPPLRRLRAGTAHPRWTATSNGRPTTTPPPSVSRPEIPALDVEPCGSRTADVGPAFASPSPTRDDAPARSDQRSDRVERFIPRLRDRFPARRRWTGRTMRPGT